MQEYKIRQDEQNIRLDKIIASIDNSISCGLVFNFF